MTHAFAVGGGREVMAERMRARELERARARAAMAARAAAHPSGTATVRALAAAGSELAGLREDLVELGATAKQAHRWRRNLRTAADVARVRHAWAHPQRLRPPRGPVIRGDELGAVMTAPGTAQSAGSRLSGELQAIDSEMVELLKQAGCRNIPSTAEETLDAAVDSMDSAADAAAFFDTVRRLGERSEAETDPTCKRLWQFFHGPWREFRDEWFTWWRKNDELVETLPAGGWTAVYNAINDRRTRAGQMWDAARAAGFALTTPRPTSAASGTLDSVWGVAKGTAGEVWGTVKILLFVAAGIFGAFLLIQAVGMARGSGGTPVILPKVRR